MLRIRADQLAASKCGLQQFGEVTEIRNCLEFRFRSNRPDFR